MTKDKALKMAIEALERIDGWLLERNLSGLMPKEKQVLNACKEALESQEIGDAEIRQMLDDIEYYQKRVEELESKEQEYDINEMIDKITPENLQKPVAWEWFEDRAYYDMYAVKQVGNKNFDEVIHVLKAKDAKYLCEWLNSLNISPAQPLSDDEIKALAEQLKQSVFGFPENIIWLARAIEQAHGIGE